MRTVNADIVLAALAAMLEVANDRDLLQATKLSIVKRRIVALQVGVENQAVEL